ncbi:uncharacterized protein DUF4267 [Frondihabitans sp. PhB188]|uniref:DUF4267 domain-containing protein n=1 Tax=Frondihabitans sp. PhB188 TaxID=2485200 RepID=UPI000F470BA2|nr:DUF4267 domain-containing protein [Frondihabitans sp. PhB188]ROQ36573.1 uncharacterized protein DUF4267 [Frondihabitans sp. PhB188]
MLTTVAFGIAIVISLAIGAIGVRFLVAPRVAAAGYGVAARQAGDPAYFSVKGVRDTCIGILGLVLVLTGQTHALGLFMLVFTLIPVADAVIVLRNGGTRATAFGIHVSTAVLVLADAVLLLIAA